MKTDKIFKITDTGIAFAFYLLFFLLPFVFFQGNSELFELPKMTTFYGLTLMVLFLWIIKSITVQKIIFKHTVLDIPLLIFLISQTVSTAFSINIHTSIFGYYSRLNGGLLSLFSYCLLYWAFVSNIRKVTARKSIIYLIFSAGILSIWGILEKLGFSPSCLIINGTFGTSCWVQKVQERVFATLGQPNWFASYLVAIVPLSWAMTEMRTKTKEKLIFFYISLLIFIALLFTNSRSGFLAFVAANAIFWLTKLYRNNFKSPKNVFKNALLILIIMAVFGTPWTPSIKHFLAPELNKQETQSNLKITESGDIRKIVWSGAVNIWKNYPILGSGPATFAYTYYNFRPIEHNSTSEWNLLYNKAHNEYLNYLANTGLFGLESYLFVIFTVFYFFLKAAVFLAGENKKHKILEGNIVTLSLFAGWTSILVTNFFGFSVVNTAFLFFIYPAIAIILENQKRVSYKIQEMAKKDIMLAILVFLIFLFFSIKNIQFWHADILYKRGKDHNSEWQAIRAAQELKKAIIINPYEPNYYNALSDSTSKIAVQLAEQEQNPAQARDFALLTEEISDKAIAGSPGDLNFWKERSVIFERLWGIDEKYFSKAEDALEKAIVIAPTDPEVRYNLGVLYQHKGENQKAIERVKEAVNLKPDYYDARLELGQLYLQNGERDKAKENFDYILKNINPKDEKVQKLLQESEMKD